MKTIPVTISKEKNKGNDSALKVTISEVAKYAGVSISTVSRVLNNHTQVNSKTRERVFKIIRELNYQPEQAAQALRKGCQLSRVDMKNIGVIFDRWATPTDSYFSRIVQAIEGEVRSHNWNLLLATPKNHLSNIFDLPLMIKEQSIRGLIIVGGQIDERVLESLRNTLGAVVMVDAESSVSGIDYVTCDNVKGAYDAVSHLINLGHRKIAMIHGPSSHYFTQGVLSGYRKAHLDCNLEYCRDLIVEMEGFYYEDGYKGMKKLLSARPFPTALFSNDEMSIGAMRAILEEGMQIPGNIAIVGFDDIKLSQQVTPFLTTVRTPRDTMGEIAVRKIMEHIESEKGYLPTRTILPVELIIRQSCGNRKEKMNG